MSIRDVLNNYNDEQNAKHGSSVEEALRETLSTLGTGIPKPTLADAGHVLKVGLNGEWMIGEDDDQELPPVTTDDNGKILGVVNGHWAGVTLETWSGGSY